MQSSAYPMDKLPESVYMHASGAWPRDQPNFATWNIREHEQQSSFWNAFDDGIYGIFVKHIIVKTCNSTTDPLILFSSLFFTQ
jgi:hypothetical protein